MEKNNNEMGHWLIFILILMCISISIILYFRLPRALDIKNENISEEIIVVN